MKGIAFYEAAAQIIPILLLVLFVEMRFLQRAGAAVNRAWPILVAAVVGIGEVDVLLYLRRDRRLRLRPLLPG